MMSSSILSVFLILFDLGVPKMQSWETKLIQRQFLNESTTVFVYVTSVTSFSCI